MEKYWNKDAIADRLKVVHENISSAVLKTGKATSDIQIMAVTKTVPVECINDVFEQGVSLFGENRAQELCQKYEDYSFTSDNIHFIGTLQSNKVRQIIDKVSCIESVNSVSLATEINKRAQAINKIMPIFLEVNIGDELAKTGAAFAEIDNMLEQIALLPYLKVSGLMTIPPFSANSIETERYFEQMYKLFVDIKHKNIDNVTMDYLSMGMSSDYTLAIAHGANIVRLGSGIFGKRS